MKVWIYEKGRENERRFKSEEEAQKWLAENDEEGVAFAEELSSPSLSQPPSDMSGFRVIRK